MYFFDLRPPSGNLWGPLDENGRRGCSRWLGDQGGFGGWKFLKSRPNKFMGGSVLGWEGCVLFQNLFCICSVKVSSFCHYIGLQFYKGCH